jgi:hypothetical protein
MWEPRRLTTLWVSTACYRDSFIFLPLCNLVNDKINHKKERLGFVHPGYEKMVTRMHGKGNEDGTQIVSVGTVDMESPNTIRNTQIRTITAVETAEIIHKLVIIRLLLVCTSETETVKMK